MKAERRKVLKARLARYGQPNPNLTNIGLVWTSILRQHYQDPDLPVIPPEIVGLMFAGFKMTRMAIPGFRADDYLDGLNYLEFAQEIDQCRKTS